MARITLSTHWKFQRLARALGSKVMARGILETLWEPCWVAGDAYLGTADDIESLCEWNGEPGALTKALLMPDAKGAGFIEPYGGRVRGSEPHYQVHDFLHHCPEYVRRRRDRELEHAAPKVCEVCGDDYFSRAPNSQVCGDRCRQRLSRQRRDANEPDSSQTGPESLVGHTARHGDVTPPCDMSRHVTPLAHTAHTHGTKSKEVSTTTAEPRPRSAAAIDPDMEDDDVPVPSPPPPARKHKLSDPPLDTSPVVLTFPVTGQGGPAWPLHAAQLARWAELYPTIDVLAEARHALAWLEANPTKRKTASGMAKCLVNWFNRSVDAPRGRSPTLVTGSLKTAGNQAAIEEFLRRRGHVVE